ncbi:MAG: hypothetical protein M3T55_00900 [Pseudomonadota bacterium]|nr:hypothetical protein [Pseudomonadota bacterium]
MEIGAIPIFSDELESSRVRTKIPRVELPVMTGRITKPRFVAVGERDGTNLSSRLPNSRQTAAKDISLGRKRFRELLEERNQ